ncbi:MAG: adenine phosphoribosyltransferase [Gemmatimonadetes bacterium]|nr:adenine phosphoribosyltransferase [Gemmatimonadota bacterium]
MKSGVDLAARIRAQVRDVPDFPKPGILFKDITPVLADGELMSAVQHALENIARPLEPELVVAIESRGFIVGAPLALALGTGFAPVRKPGKLPWTTRRVEYALEYGSDAVEAHTDAIRAQQRVLIVDDVLATGGTAAATAQLVRQLAGQVVGFAFVIELAFLGGRARLDSAPVHSLLQYE